MDGVADSFALFWQKIAQEFKDYDNVVGYEIMNGLLPTNAEPFNGDVFLNPKLNDADFADFVNLQPFYNRVSDAIRKADMNGIIFFDLAIGDSRRSTSGFTQVPGGSHFSNRTAVSYHHYTAIASENNNISYTREKISDQIKDARRLNTGMMLTEFEFGVEDVDNILHKIEACDGIVFC